MEQLTMLQLLKKKETVKESVTELISAETATRIVSLQFCAERAGEPICEVCGKLKSECDIGPFTETPGRRVCIEVRRAVPNDSALQDGTEITSFEKGDRIWNGQTYEAYEPNA